MCHYIVPFVFFENDKNLDRSDDGKRRKKKRMASTAKKTQAMILGKHSHEPALHTTRITRNLRQNGGRPDSTQTFRSLRMAADRYREMYGEN